MTKAQCRLCRDIIGYARGSPGSLVKHLRASHSRIYDQAKTAAKLIEAAADSEETSTTTTQLTISALDIRQYAKGHSERIKRDVALMHAVVSRQWAVDIVYDGSFRNLMICMDQRYSWRQQA